MPSPLEAYLSEVAAHLGPIPVKQRNEELREMRSHLENAVIVSREMGRSEEEAAHNVMAQFGTPKDLGENVVWAWRRGRKQTVKSFLEATFIALGLSCTVPPLVGFLMFRYLPCSPYWTGHNYMAYNHMAWFLTRNFTTWALVGVGTGFSFPKRAVAGTAFVMGGISLCFTAYALELHLYDLVNLSYGTIFFSTAIAAAWIGSRWRLTWGKRRRLARV